MDAEDTERVMLAPTENTAEVSATVEVQGVTIANTSTPSRIRPLSAPSVSGDPIQLRGVRHAPVDVVV